MSHSDYSIADALGASIIDSSPSTLLVEFSDGSVESIDRHSPLGQFAQIDVFDTLTTIRASGRALVNEQTLEAGGTGINVSFTMDPTSEQGNLTVGDTEPLTLTGEDLTDALTTVLDAVPNDPDDDFKQNDIELRGHIADNIYTTYESILEGRVREDVVNNIGKSEYGPSIEVTENGWIVQDTYLLTYEAENYLSDDVTTYKRDGDGVATVDSKRQAIGLSFDGTQPRMVADIKGSEYVLSETEQEFLASAEFLISPSHYLEVESFQNEVYGAIKDAKGYANRSDIIDLAGSASISHYIDPKTGLLHKHGIDKHVLRTSFSVRPWVIRELHYDSFDHAGVAELVYREEELREDARDVFADTDNDDDERWEEISSTADDAPCPPEVYQRLRAMYGSP